MMAILEADIEFAGDVAAMRRAQGTPLDGPARRHSGTCAMGPSESRLADTQPPKPLLTMM